MLARGQCRTQHLIGKGKDRLQMHVSEKCAGRMTTRQNVFYMFVVRFMESLNKKTYLPDLKNL